MTGVRTRYSEIGTDVTGDIGQKAWSKEDPGNQERSVKEFRKMLVQSFDQYYDSGL